MSAQLQSRWHTVSVVSVNKLYEHLHLRTSMIHPQPAPTWGPPTDVYECEHLYAIKIAVSGLKRSRTGDLEDAEVLIMNDTIVVRGNRRDQCPHKKCTIHQMEIHYGPFEVRVRIRAPFGRDGVTARYSDGFLLVLVPKAERTLPGSHRIEVQG